MLEWEEGSRTLLGCFLASCGGSAGPFFGLAQRLFDESELSEKDEQLVQAVFRAEIRKVTNRMVLWRFGSVEHYQEMKDQADKNLISVAWEVPADLRPFLHTTLPIKNNTYENGKLKFELGGLTLFGEVREPMVAHLAAAFHYPGDVRDLVELLSEQADNELFVIPSGFTSFNYEGTSLQALTIEARKKLGQ